MRSVFFITKGPSNSSVCCPQCVLIQEAVPGFFNHSVDRATGLLSRPKIGLLLFSMAALNLRQEGVKQESFSGIIPTPA